MHIRGHVLHDSVDPPSTVTTTTAASITYDIAICNDCSACVCAKASTSHVEMIKVHSHAHRLPLVTSAACVCITCDREVTGRGSYVLHKVNRVVHRAEIPFAIPRNRQLRVAKCGPDVFDYLSLESRAMHGHVVSARAVEKLLEGYIEHLRSKNPRFAIRKNEELDGEHALPLLRFMKSLQRPKTGATTETVRILAACLARNLRRHLVWKQRELQRHQYFALTTSYGLECAETVRAVYMTGSVWTFLSDAALIRALGSANLGVAVVTAAPPFDDEDTLFRESGFRAHLLAVGVEEACDAEGEFDRCVREHGRNVDVRVTQLNEEADFSFGDSFEESLTLTFPITDEKVERLRRRWNDLLRSDRCEVRLVIDARCPLLRLQLGATRKRRAPASPECGRPVSSRAAYVRLSSAWTDDRTLRGCVRIMRKVFTKDAAPSYVRVIVWDNRELLPKEVSGGRGSGSLRQFLDSRADSLSYASMDSKGIDRLGDLLERVDLGAIPCDGRTEGDELRVSDDLCGSDDYVVGGWVVNHTAGIAGIVREIRDAHAGSKHKKLAARVCANAEASSCAHLLRVELVGSDADSAERFEVWVVADGARWRPVDGFPLVCAHQLRSQAEAGRRFVLCRRRPRSTEAPRDSPECWSWLLACANLCALSGPESRLLIARDEAHDEEDNAQHFLCARAELYYALTCDRRPDARKVVDHAKTKM